MTDHTDLETRLRGALRPVDPGADFSDRVLRRLASAPSPRVSTAPRWALAACVFGAIGAGLLFHLQQEQQRRTAAVNDLHTALALTSRELDQLHHHLDFKIREMP